MDYILYVLNPKPQILVPNILARLGPSIPSAPCEISTNLLAKPQYRKTQTPSSAARGSSRIAGRRGSGTSGRMIGGCI